jgi:hypothetical protein
MKDSRICSKMTAPPFDAVLVVAPANIGEHLVKLMMCKWPGRLTRLVPLNCEVKELSRNGFVGAGHLAVSEPDLVLLASNLTVEMVPARRRGQTICGLSLTGHHRF